jgi:hypothetical protein
MKYFDPDEWTYGYELELGDVRRDRLLPEWMGKWEYAETDICNLHGDYKNIACDPLGTEPPVGGEINIVPQTTPEKLHNVVWAAIEWFYKQGDQPSASCVNHGHTHIHIPGLIGDVEALKKLTSYIKQWQHLAIEKCYGYEEHPLMAEAKTARTYLKWDGGRPMPDWMADNITEHAIDFDDFIRLQCCGKDARSRGRPFRYSINTYCLKHTRTVEFRLYRGTIEPDEILDSILFMKEFMNAALNTGEPLPSILARKQWSFPQFIYDHENYLGWENTKWSKERGKKVREFRNAV